MMTTQAPGKLILLGEYAVLEGAPALVAAIDRHARVTLSPGDDTWQLRAPHLDDRSWRFHITAAGPEWLDPNPPKLPDAVLATLALDLVQAQPASLTLDTGDFFHDGKKLGLGSSAALTVALVRGLSQHAGLSGDPTDLFDRALAAHLRFQGGAGSGADLAASVAGGFIRYRMADTPRFQAVAWPARLAVAPVWTGQAASTRQLLAGLDRWRNRHPKAAQARLVELSMLASQGDAALGESDPHALLDCVTAYAAVLETLGCDAGIDIVSPPHRELARLAGPCGVAYKPSGAGHGDFGIGFSMDTEGLDAWIKQAREAGFRTPLSTPLHTTMAATPC